MRCSRYNWARYICIPPPVFLSGREFHPEGQETVRLSQSVDQRDVQGQSKSGYDSGAAGMETDSLPFIHECQVHSAGPQRQQARIKGDQLTGISPRGG